MPRCARQAPGGLVYHALDRSVARLPLFQEEGDYEAFEQLLAEALAVNPTRILAYCFMPNHWHFVLWPRADGELTAFLRWLTHTHTMRWHAQHRSAGTGHLYQGRFKSFPVEADDHLYAVVRYVERNPLRAGLVQRAERWRWSSLCRWRSEDEAARLLLHPAPVPFPEGWLVLVNEPQTDSELAELRQAVTRGRPYGSPAWQQRIASWLGLEHTLRPRGRPRKHQADPEAAPGAGA